MEKKELIKDEDSLYHKFLGLKKHFKSIESIIEIIFPLYSLHNHRHSETIINILDSFNHKKLLKKFRLNKFEIFYLISSAYLHDTGMMIIEKEDKEKDNYINTKNIRRNHNYRSFNYILESANELGLDESEAHTLAWICKGHRNENLYDNPNYYPVPCSDDPNYTIRINLLTALLRIADELDISFKRVKKDMKKFLVRVCDFDTITNLHWYKHYYTINYSPSFVEKSGELPKLLIELFFQLPDKSYENSFVIPFVIKPIKKEIDYLQKIFNYYGFSVDIKNTSHISINPELGKIPPEVYDDIFSSLLIKQNIRILIADDDDISRRDFSYIIKELGYGVDMAIDSVSALEKIEKSLYHLILLDLKMPDLSRRTRNDAGLELLKKIKESGQNSIVVIVSGLTQSPLIRECFRNGAYDFVMKDIDSQEEIATIIEQALRMNYYLINEGHMNHA